jgi:glutathione S-transferase
MWQLYQFPLCPFSRKVRLMLGEKGVAHELVRESPWLKRDEFVDINPAGQTPVLVEDQKGTVLIDSAAICEYFEETIQKAPMIPGTAVNRAEVRRLVAWADDRLYREVVGPIMEERMRKRLVTRDPPDTRVLREAMKTADSNLDYLDFLLDHRRWLAGPVLSLADLAVAAHLSVADYLGGIDWRGHKQTMDWYSVMKSRPSFRPLLTERMEVIAPPAHYDKVDFF